MMLKAYLLPSLSQSSSFLWEIRLFHNHVNKHVNNQRQNFSSFLTSQTSNSQVQKQLYVQNGMGYTHQILKQCSKSRRLMQNPVNVEKNVADLYRFLTWTITNVSAPTKVLGRLLKKKNIIFRMETWRWVWASWEQRSSLWQNSHLQTHRPNSQGWAPSVLLSCHVCMCFLWMFRDLWIYWWWFLFTYFSIYLSIYIYLWLVCYEL